jgi:hypothetical protein
MFPNIQVRKCIWPDDYSAKAPITIFASLLSATTIQPNDHRCWDPPLQAHSATNAPLAGAAPGLVGAPNSPRSAAAYRPWTTGRGHPGTCPHRPRGSGRPRCAKRRSRSEDRCDRRRCDAAKVRHHRRQTGSGQVVAIAVTESTRRYFANAGRSRKELSARKVALACSWSTHNSSPLWCRTQPG